MKRKLFVYDEEKTKQYKKISAQHKLEWLEQMSEFMFNVMTPKAKRFSRLLKEGKI